MIEFKLKTTLSNFKSLLYCAGNVTDYTSLNWIHRPERSDAYFNVGANSNGQLIIWKDGKIIDFTIYGQRQGEGVHWDIELTEGSVKV